MSSGYCDYIIDMLAPRMPVTARKMFGGYGFYRSGLMFGIFTGESVYFKVDDSNRPDYETAGMEPFTYEANGRRTTLSYWQVPAEVLDDESALCEWAEKAFAVAVAAAAKKKPAKSAKPNPNQPLHKLRSIGPKSAGWLKEVGIETGDDLRALGAVAAYRRLKEWNPKAVSLNMLWALHAALEGISWKEINPETKARLKREAGAGKRK